MANTRIKDISTTTSTTNADDYIAIDGATSGTRKITASTLGGNFDENVVVEFGGNKTTYASNFLRSENGAYYIDAYTTGGDIIFRTSVASALDTQSMIIDGATGNVAIGTTSASHPLTVTGNSYLIGASSSIIGNNDATNYALSDSSGVLQNKWYGGHEWYTLGSNQRMKLDSSGNLILTKGGGAYLQFKDASAVRGAINVGTSDGLTFTTGASFTERMRIDSGGNVSVTSGVINIGAADTASGHINAFENLTFNIDSDNDDSGTRYFAWHTNGSSGSGSELMRLLETGDLAIGRTSAGARIDLATATDTAGIFVRDSSDSSITHQIYNASGNGNIAIYADGGANTVNINSAGDTFLNGGSVGIGTASPSELLHLNAASGGVNSRALSRAHFGGQYADHSLVLGYCAKADTAGNAQMVVTETSGTGATGNPAAIRMKTGAIEFHTANAGTSGAAFSSQRWAIDPSGNLVANSTGIDFGSGASTTIDSYEEGTWTPVFAPNGGSFATATTYTYIAKYTKVGNLVTANCYIRTDGTLDITGGSSAVRIQGLPFSTTSSNDYVSVNVGYALNWSAVPAGGYVAANNSYILLSKRETSITGNLNASDVSDLDTSGGAKNEIMITVTYQTT
jgi:hypothetical protein